MFFLHSSLFSSNKRIYFYFKVQSILSLKYVQFTVIIVLYVAFFFFTIFAQSLSDKLFMDWLKIPIANWIRFLLTIPIATVFPGCMVLTLFDGWKELNILEKFIFSSFFSLFLIPLLGFAITVLGYSIKGTIGLVFLTTALVQLCIYFINVKSMNEKIEGDSNVHSYSRYKIVRPDHLLLFVIFISALVLFLGRSLLGVYPGDERFHLGLSLTFEKTFLTVTASNGRTFGPSYPYWIHIFLSVFFTLSGFPAVNAYIILHFLLLLPIMGFYLLATTFFEKKDIATISTLIYTFFAGFGWLYALFLKTQYSSLDPKRLDSLLRFAGLKTGDILILISGHEPTFMIRSFSLSCFFILIYLIRRYKYLKSLHYILASSVTILGYLAHYYEIILFVPFYMLYVLLFMKNSGWKLTLSMIFGLSFVALIDFLAPGMRYTMGVAGEVFGNYMFSVNFALLIAFFFLQYCFRNLKIQFSSLPKSFVIKMRRSCFIIIMCYYILGWVVYLFLFQRLNLSYNAIWGKDVIPWYFDPIRFGVAGILALVSIKKYLWSEKWIGQRDFLFLAVFTCYIVLIPLLKPLLNLFWLGRVYSPMVSIKWGRLQFFLWVPVSILATHTLMKIIPHNIRTNFSKVLKSIVLIVITLGGIVSTVLCYEVRATSSIPFHPSTEELEALNYLRLNCRSNSSILTVTSTSRSIIMGFVGIDGRRVFGGDWWNDIFYRKNNPEILFYFADAYNIRYLYLASRDLEYGLNHYGNSYIFGHLIRYLSPVFENNAVVIYMIPHFSPPSDENSELVVAIPNLLKEIRVGWESEDFNEGWNMDLYKGLGSGNVSVIGGVMRIEHIFNESVYEHTAVNIALPDINSSEYPCVTFKARIDDPAKQHRGYLLFYDNEGKLIKSGVSVESLDYEVFQVHLPSNRTISKLSFILSDSGNEDVNGTFHLYIDYIKFFNFVDFSRSYFYLLELASLASLNYSVYLENDYSIFKHRIILMSDTKEIDVLDEYNEWISEGGTLVVFNMDGFGCFANLLSIETKSDVKFANEIAGENKKIMIEDVKITPLYSCDIEIKTMANWMKNGKIVSPFAFYRKMGNGQVIYVNLLPCINKLESLKDPKVRATMFINLKEFLTILKIDLPKSKRTSLSLFPGKYFVAGENVSIVGEAFVQFGSFTLFPLSANISELHAGYTCSQNIFHADLIKFNSKVLKDVDIKNIEVFGESESIINSATCKLINGFGKYSLIKIDGSFNWTIQIHESSIAVILIEVDNLERKIYIQNGTVEFINLCHKMLSQSFLVRNLKILAKGKLSLERYYHVFPFMIELNSPFGYGDPIVLHGTITLTPRIVNEKLFIATSPLGWNTS